MARWLRLLLGKAAATPSPRAVLAAAVSEFADASLVERTLALYDAPHAFEEYALESGHEPPWLEEERNPTPEELASEVLLRVLFVEGYVGHIDWADGVNSILGIFDSLFLKRGVPTLNAEERATLTRSAIDSVRGDAFMQLLDPLQAAAKTRGFEIVYLDLGQDAHFPLLLTTDAFRRWRKATFGKGVPVLP
jgi:hypothetical protein